MRKNKRIAVVIPAHNESTQILGVINSMPEFVDHIVIVDDASSDDTAAIVERETLTNARVILVRHEKNRGVGGAVSTGYLRARELDIDVCAVMDGDGQMPAADLERIVDPVLDGRCDYAKANRLSSGEAWKIMPRTRYLGNAGLTFLTKIASGYYAVTDSQTGFVAISRDMLDQIDVGSLYPRYGYPNDMLVRLNVAHARVVDVPSKPVYNVGEKSGLKVYKVMFTLSRLILRRFWWRLAMKYVVRDFHPLVIFYVAGLVLGLLGLVAGLFLLPVAIAQGRQPTAAEAVFVSLALSSGLLLTLFAMLFDFEANQHLTPDANRQRDARPSESFEGKLTLSYRCESCGEAADDEVKVPFYARPVPHDRVPVG